jgi:hypothetical protein
VLCHRLENPRSRRLLAVSHTLDAQIGGESPGRRRWSRGRRRVLAGIRIVSEIGEDQLAGFSLSRLNSSLHQVLSPPRRLVLADVIVIC